MRRITLKCLHKMPRIVEKGGHHIEERAHLEDRMAPGCA